jgi:hypothetical protein
MEIEILQVLHSSKLRWTKLNEVLKQELSSYKPREQATEAKNQLTALVEKSLIELQNDAFLQLDQPKDGSLDHFFNLNDLEIFGRILEKGAAELANSTKNWYETENARFQYENSPKIERRAKAALINSRIAIVISLLALGYPLIVWFLKKIGFWPF